MANHFNMNDNKESLGGTEFSSTTPNCGFSNDAMTLNYSGVPDFSTTPTEITYTVIFNNADNNGGTSTYTAVPFSTIGSAIEEKQLEITKYAPLYYFNGGRVDENCIIQIKEDIVIDVEWVKVAE